jgi:hypothetical protein
MITLWTPVVVKLRHGATMLTLVQCAATHCFADEGAFRGYFGAVAVLPSVAGAGVDGATGSGCVNGSEARRDA